MTPANIVRGGHLAANCARGSKVISRQLCTLSAIGSDCSVHFVGGRAQRCLSYGSGCWFPRACDWCTRNTSAQQFTVCVRLETLLSEFAIAARESKAACDIFLLIFESRALTAVFTIDTGTRALLRKAFRWVCATRIRHLVYCKVNRIGLSTRVFCCDNWNPGVSTHSIASWQSALVFVLCAGGVLRMAVANKLHCVGRGVKSRSSSEGICEPLGGSHSLSANNCRFSMRLTSAASISDSILWELCESAGAQRVEGLQAAQRGGSDCLLARCEVFLRVELAQSQRRSANIDHFAEFRVFRIKFWKHTVRVSVLNDAYECAWPIQLLDCSLIITSLSAPVT